MIQENTNPPPISRYITKSHDVCVCVHIVLKLWVSKYSFVQECWVQNGDMLHNTITDADRCIRVLYLPSEECNYVS